MIMMGKPDMEEIRKAAQGKTDGDVTYPRQKIMSVQASMALFNDEWPKATWEIYVGDRRIPELPATAEFGELITIRDGVTYMAVRALNSSQRPWKKVFKEALRTLKTSEGEEIKETEVMLLSGGAEAQPCHAGFKIMPAMTINAYLYHSDTPLSPASDEELAKLFGGFVVTFGDVAEYGNFEAFQEAMKATTLDFYDISESVAYTLGDTQLTAGWKPVAHARVTVVSEDGKFTGWGEDYYFRVNGETPYPGPSVLKDTPLSQMGRWRLEKNGATLMQRKGTKPLMLRTFPKQGITVAINPTPDYKEYNLRTADGVYVSADGLLSMGRWVVRGKEKADIWYCAFENDEVPEEKRATVIFMAGMAEKPVVTLNDEDITGRVIENEKWWTIPLK